MWRIRHVAACIALVAFAFNCDSGLLVPDTKLDLTINPLAFLGRALHMWDPQGLAGQVQNQAYGYLFPMGPFFALGKAMAIPMWAVQRLWWSALLCVGFMGVVTLARRMEIGTPASRMIAGLAFALSPHLLTVLGPVSAEALPACLAPWVMVPLVTAVREGSPRRAAMRSGIAVLLMGAINAALVLAALLPAALWLLTRRPDRRTRRLTGAWLLAVFLATAWWVAPLLLFGHYSAAFLGRIESATTTTGTATIVESLRGTSDWVAYLPTQGWHAGSLLLSQPAVVLNTVVVVALGLGGLAQRGVPHRNWLITCLLCGVVIVGIGYGGAVHGLFAGSARDLLDGALAPLRNVHKFDVAIRLPLVLGLAHLVGRLRWGTNPAERRISRVVVLAVAAAAVAGAATPLIALRIAPAGTFADVPAYWRQAATWLGDQHAQGRSLLLPGSRFGQYLWGNPGDEPLQPLAASTWDVRAAVPLSNAGHVRMLDAIDAQLASGRSSAGLSAYLARSGVRYVVVRNDLDLNTADVPRPVLVHEALANSPGLSLVQSFGGLVGDATTPGNIVDQHLQQPYPAVEIWTVSDAADPRVEAVPADATVQVSGGPESLLPLSDQGLGSSEPAVLTGDSTARIPPGGGCPDRRAAPPGGQQRRQFARHVGHADAGRSPPDVESGPRLPAVHRQPASELRPPDRCERHQRVEFRVRSRLLRRLAAGRSALRRIRRRSADRLAEQPVLQRRRPVAPDRLHLAAFRRFVERRVPHAVHGQPDRGAHGRGIRDDGSIRPRPRRLERDRRPHPLRAPYRDRRDAPRRPVPPGRRHRVVDPAGHRAPHDRHAAGSGPGHGIAEHRL